MAADHNEHTLDRVYVVNGSQDTNFSQLCNQIDNLRIDDNQTKNENQDALFRSRSLPSDQESFSPLLRNSQLLPYAFNSTLKKKEKDSEPRISSGLSSGFSPSNQQSGGSSQKQMSESDMALSKEIELHNDRSKLGSFQSGSKGQSSSQSKGSKSSSQSLVQLISLL